MSINGFRSVCDDEAKWEYKVNMQGGIKWKTNEYLLEIERREVKYWFSTTIVYLKTTDNLLERNTFLIIFRSKKE